MTGVVVKTKMTCVILNLFIYIPEVLTCESKSKANGFDLSPMFICNQCVR